MSRDFLIFGSHTPQACFLCLRGRFCFKGVRLGAGAGGSSGIVHKSILSHVVLSSVLPWAPSSGSASSPLSRTKIGATCRVFATAEERTKIGSGFAS
eukprot:1172331-Pyramimonas_sp.AAC.2